MPPSNSDETTLLDFFSSGRRSSYGTKELIYRLGDVPSGVYFIKSGMVKIYTLNSRADESIILTLRAGETFLLGWALSGKIGPIYIAAMMPTEVLRISREHLVETCKTNSAVSYLILRELAEQFVLLSIHLNNLDYRSAYERVVCQLLRIAERHGKQARTGAFIINRVNASHSHIAGSTNLARETVTRELNALEAEGIIRRVQNTMVIPDVKKLANRVELDWPLVE